MHLLQSNWFWGLVIASPIVTTISILARLARRERAPTSTGADSDADAARPPSSSIQDNEQK